MHPIRIRARTIIAALYDCICGSGEFDGLWSNRFEGRVCACVSVLYAWLRNPTAASFRSRLYRVQQLERKDHSLRLLGESIIGYTTNSLISKKHAIIRRRYILSLTNSVLQLRRISGKKWSKLPWPMVYHLAKTVPRLELCVIVINHQRFANSRLFWLRRSISKYAS